jgi:outer membrane lipoprotein-sorting protein
MNRRVCFWLGVILFCITLCTGCGLKTLSANEVRERLGKDFEDMTDYSVIAQITYYSGEQPEIYETKHFFKKPGLYRSEVVKPENMKGKAVLFDGQKQHIIYPGAGDSVVVDNPWEDENPGLLFKVMQRFSEQPSDFSVKQQDSDKYYTLEIRWDESNPIAQKQRLWLDGKTLKPVKLEIIQAEGKPLAVVEYLQLELNKGLRPELFTLGYKPD